MENSNENVEKLHVKLHELEERNSTLVGENFDLRYKYDQLLRDYHETKSKNAGLIIYSVTVTIFLLALLIW